MLRNSSPHHAGGRGSSPHGRSAWARRVLWLDFHQTDLPVLGPAQHPARGEFQPLRVVLRDGVHEQGPRPLGLCNGVHLDFIRPGRPVENGYIKSFNGRLRDECLNVGVFFNLADARRKLHLWRRDNNLHRRDTKHLPFPPACLRHSLELQYAQTCPLIRAKSNHASRTSNRFWLSYAGRITSRNFQSPMARFSGAGHLRENSSFNW